MQELIAQFCGITGASPENARRFLDKYKRLDAAVDEYYANPPPAQPQARSAGPSTTKITQLFDKYKGVCAPRPPGRTGDSHARTAADEAPADPTADLITFDGTQAFCDDLGVTPEDTVLLVLAYELGSPRLGEWPRKGWVDGWRSLGCAPLLVQHLAGR
jgi:DCN1-like protein 1/2